MKEFITLLMLTGVILIFLYIILNHVVVIRYFFFDKKYDNKILIPAIINCLATILIYLLIKYTFLNIKNKHKIQDKPCHIKQ